MFSLNALFFVGVSNCNLEIMNDKVLETLCALFNKLILHLANKPDFCCLFAR